MSARPNARQGAARRRVKTVGGAYKKAASEGRAKDRAGFAKQGKAAVAGGKKIDAGLAGMADAGDQLPSSSSSAPARCRAADAQAGPEEGRQEDARSNSSSGAAAAVGTPSRPRRRPRRRPSCPSPGPTSLRRAAAVAAVAAAAVAAAAAAAADGGGDEGLSGGGEG